MSTVKIGISVPTYNEVTNIERLLSEVKDTFYKIPNIKIIVAVVDDSSPDGTGNLVQKISKRISSPNFKIILLSRKEKDGFGRACVAGFKKLLEQNVDYIIQMDADLSHNPAYLPAFVEEASHHDFIVASRYIKGGDTPDWPWHRRFLSKYGNYYARLILSRRITDYTGGYNLYSAKLLQAINLDSLQASGYGFLIELKYRALQKSKSFSQIPIIFNDRQHGQSKIPKSTLFNNLLLVPRIKLIFHNK